MLLVSVDCRVFLVVQKRSCSHVYFCVYDFANRALSVSLLAIL